MSDLDCVAGTAKQLQWGRTREGPEMYGALPEIEDAVMLQWGRTREGPEIVEALVSDAVE